MESHGAPCCVSEILFPAASEFCDDEIRRSQEADPAPRFVDQHRCTIAIAGRQATTG
ncbi:MAG: hypothetical protein NNA22_06680 [Nitrospira sp.]|nr:hypothetical protein [Nitrospira sp.]